MRKKLNLNINSDLSGKQFYFPSKTFFVKTNLKELTEIDKNKTAMAVLSPSSPQGLLAESAGGSTPGADGTSKQIVTNEVFDKPDPILLFEDGDDDITHAPEIQSMEVGKLKEKIFFK